MKRIVTFLLVLVMVAGMIPATVWAAEAYTITFDPNGGTCATETVTVNEGEAIGTLPVPVREDRIFKGWYLDVENGTRITEEEVFAESTTLYAKWGYAAWFNDDYYYLGNKASGIGLVNNGSKVELGERYSEASRWHFVMQEDYTFKVISAVDGSVLDVTEDGTGVCTAPDTDAPTQRWLIGEIGWAHRDGFSLYSVATGKVLTVVSEGTEFAEGDGVQLAWEDGSTAQGLYISNPNIHDGVYLNWELIVGEEQEESMPATETIDENWYITLTVDEDYVEVTGTKRELDWQYFTLMPKKTGIIEGVLNLYDSISSKLLYSRTIVISIEKDDKSRQVRYYDEDQLLRGEVVEEGTTITIPKDFIPTKAGYIFHSWNTDYDCLGDTYMPGDKIKVNGNIYLYAEWKYDTRPPASVQRFVGADRYRTAFLTANQMLDSLDMDQFENIVVASGTDFADALSGSYLAAVKNAPILLVRNRNQEINAVKDYIKKNLAPGGTVYLLGGEKALPKSMETGLDDFTVKRLGGATRYATNLLILEEAGVGDKDILICTGEGFADSLSASAAERPILLVKNSLSADQKKFLEGTTGKKYIIGGTGAVSARIENAVKAYGEVERLGGATRYYTSVLVAEEFFDTPDLVGLACGQNFPDGLSGGSLAAALNIPLILTDNGKQTAAAGYVSEKDVQGAYVLGGAGLISDSTVRKVFAERVVEDIIVIK